MGMENSKHIGYQKTSKLTSEEKDTLIFYLLGLLEGFVDEINRQKGSRETVINFFEQYCPECKYLVGKHGLKFKKSK